MKLSELADEKFASDPEIKGLTADSRAVEDGFLFAALPGVLMDGAKFIPDAEKKGAAAILGCPGIRSGLPVVADEKPRRRLADMAARFYPRQPKMIAGVTGTNGKTSTALFASQLWSMLGENAASMGTLGVRGKAYKAPLSHTTPEPVTLHCLLDDMASAGVDYLIMEVSSHALAQYRADGVKFSVAAFSNITQDHLDYHSSFEDYLENKLRLFAELLEDDGVAVVNMDDPSSEKVCAAVEKRGIQLMKVGKGDDDIKLVETSAHSEGLKVHLEAEGERYSLNLPLIGAFQAENACLAAGVVIASGARPGDVLPLLERLEAAPGRMELAVSVNDAAVYVDYAHTPDAVATALKSIRPHTERRLITIIGAGGDRDKEKRSLMGRAAADNADCVIVTDDNPRTEEPDLIRKDVLAGCSDAIEVGDRKEAIVAGVAMLEAGDVLLIAGKGHETGQTVGAETLPFNDVDVAKAAALDRSKELGR